MCCSGKRLNVEPAIGNDIEQFGDEARTSPEVREQLCHASQFAGQRGTTGDFSSQR